MKKKHTRIIGIALILLSWIFWGLVFAVPFFRLGVKHSAIAISILLAATNIFWVGTFLAGKEMIRTSRIWQKIKKWTGRSTGRMDG